MHYSVDMFKEKTSSSVQTEQNTDNELISGDSNEREAKTKSQAKPTKQGRNNRQNSGNSTKRGKGSNEELASS